MLEPSRDQTQAEQTDIHFRIFNSKDSKHLYELQSEYNRLLEKLSQFSHNFRVGSIYGNKY